MAEVTAIEFGLTGRYGAFFRKFCMNPDMTMMTRIQLGLSAGLVRLNATAEWEGIHREWDHGAPPAIPMGELDQAF